MRTIGPADVEHYHGGMVQIVAKSLTTRDFDSLSYRSKQRILDKAVKIVGLLVNDEHTLNQMFVRYRSLAAEGRLGEKQAA